MEAEKEKSFGDLLKESEHQESDLSKLEGYLNTLKPPMSSSNITPPKAKLQKYFYSSDEIIDMILSFEEEISDLRLKLQRSNGEIVR